MPKAKARSESDSSDSGPEDRNPLPKKKAKTSSSANSSDEETWSLGKNRSVTLREFKGRWMIDIREFYEAGDGNLKPGKKGIALSMEQWQKLVSNIDDIKSAIKRRV